jgi:hypothetical protein
MMLQSRYDGRFHQVVEESKAREGRDTLNVRILEPHEAFVSILWAGGWDEYIVHLGNLRPLEAGENEGHSPTTNDNRLKGWTVKRQMWGTQEICPESHCIRILRHLAGGD